MATSQDRNLMLSVRDFGPIYSAEIELRPLTVFVGPSNTGKSYLAILIYALHKFFNSRRTRDLLIFPDRKSLLDESYPRRYSISEERYHANLIDGWTKCFASKREFFRGFSLPDEIASLIRPCSVMFSPAMISPMK